MSQMSIHNWITFMMVSPKVLPFAGHILSEPLCIVFLLLSSLYYLETGKLTQKFICPTKKIPWYDKKGELILGELDSWKEYALGWYIFYYSLIQKGIIKKICHEKIWNKMKNSEKWRYWLFSC